MKECQLGQPAAGTGLDGENGEPQLGTMATQASQLKAAGSWRSASALELLHIRVPHLPEMVRVNGLDG